MEQDRIRRIDSKISSYKEQLDSKPNPTAQANLLRNIAILFKRKKIQTKNIENFDANKQELELAIEKVEEHLKDQAKVQIVDKEKISEATKTEVIKDSSHAKLKERLVDMFGNNWEEEEYSDDFEEDYLDELLEESNMELEKNKVSSNMSQVEKNIEALLDGL